MCIASMRDAILVLLEKWRSTEMDVIVGLMVMKCLVRKTIYVSKTLQMHDFIIGLFVNH